MFLIDLLSNVGFSLLRGIASFRMFLSFNSITLSYYYEYTKTGRGAQTALHACVQHGRQYSNSFWIQPPIQERSIATKKFPVLQRMHEHASVTEQGIDTIILLHEHLITTVSSHEQNNVRVVQSTSLFSRLTSVRVRPGQRGLRGHLSIKKLTLLSKPDASEITLNIFKIKTSVMERNQIFQSKLFSNSSVRLN